MFLTGCGEGESTSAPPTGNPNVRGANGAPSSPARGESTGQYLNVMGSNLKSCSTPGTAMTGFTRNGHCTDMGNDDDGSHHICIEMKSDFCSVTGQPNWCGDEMQCMGQQGVCPIKNWCVCQWAFASYIESAGGCDQIVNIVCDATNMAALKAYKSTSSSDPQISAALQCLEKRCALPNVVDI